MGTIQEQQEELREKQEAEAEATEKRIEKRVKAAITGADPEIPALDEKKGKKNKHSSDT